MLIMPSRQTKQMSLLIIISLVWLHGAIASILSEDRAILLLKQAGLSSVMATMWFLLGILADAVMAIWAIGLIGVTRFKPTKLTWLFNLFWQISIILISIYTILASWWVPILWLDPFGALIKNAVILWVCVDQLNHQSERDHAN
jgi:hypothetical protein